VHARRKEIRVNPLIILDSCSEKRKITGRSRRIGDDFGIGKFSYGEYVPRDMFYLRSSQDIAVLRLQMLPLMPPRSSGSQYCNQTLRVLPTGGCRRGIRPV
jgi:hypothetical protein